MQHRLWAAVGAAFFTSLVLAGTASAENRQVKIINETSSDLSEFYASNVGAKDWEEDILGDDEVPAGGSVTINMDDGSGYCKFDFKGVFADDSEVVEEGIDVCEVGVVRFTE
ncbi:MULTISPECIES: hypothetical protein [Kaistia]|uniref:Argininosuccinate lyase n=1 Tax=Kaistia nematophila TaxID=2994654 RepID=A0A9X3E327_9HYPH|nr:hypothetical protein [Kaistia nematophila]MCX5570750.1 hypothetical protein [Kaistia nematophila]